jgi:LacI family transcriptional regulator
MAGRRPTVRTIGAALQLSRSTVSNALRGQKGVKPETAVRIRQYAAKVGYRSNPLATKVMSQMRRTSEARHLGTLGVLELDEPGRPPAAALFNQRLLQGIRKRAAELGFTAVHRRFGAGSPSLKELNKALYCQGIEGLLFLPSWSEPDLMELDWTRFTAVYTDYLIRRPALHTVSTDHFRSLFDAVDRARSHGYRRVGLAVARRADERLNFRWAGAYLSYLHEHPEMTYVPPLAVDEVRAENFEPWFREHQPEVVVAHWIDAPPVMAAAGAAIPRTHGFVCLNVLAAPPEYSGYDLLPTLLGTRAVEIVISQIERHDRGIPGVPSNTLVPARWVDRGTLAPRV